MRERESKMELKPREAIVRMQPYRPPSSGRAGKLRLDFNENTEGCPPRVMKVLGRLGREEAAVYPEYERALPAMAAHFDVKPDQLTLTNGTDEAIQLVVNTYVDAGDGVVILRPSYAMYRFYAQVMGARVREVDYPEDLRYPASRLLRAINSRTRAVLIANPNNPTGSSASEAQLRELLRAAPRAAVLIDEAYFEFSGQTVLPWISRYANLFVSRTFSKAYGLAGLRVGCLFSRKENIAAIRKGQSPYSVNAAAVRGALEAIRDDGAIRKYVDEVQRARKMLCEALTRLRCRYYPSDANFVLVNFGGDARRLHAFLAQRGILVRDRTHEIAGCVRVTVGNMAQTRRLIRELQEAVGRGRNAGDKS